MHSSKVQIGEEKPFLPKKNKTDLTAEVNCLLPLIPFQRSNGGFHVRCS